MTDPKRPDGSVSFEYISPALALALLNASPVNWRNQNRNQIRLYMRQMLDALWKPAASTIIIGVDGVVMDGAHRLHAILESDTGQWFIVYRGAPLDIANKIDIGLGRTATDLMKHLISQDHNYWAQLLSAVKRYEMGGRIDAVSGKFSLAELEDYFVGNEAFQALGQAALDYYKTAKASVIKIPPIQAAFLWYACALDGTPEKASEFFDGIFSGVGLEGTDPRFALREAVIAETSRATGSTFAGHQGQRTIRMWTWVAWEKFSNGDSFSHRDKSPSSSALKRSATARLKAA